MPSIDAARVPTLLFRADYNGTLAASRSLASRDGFFLRQAMKHALGPVYVSYYNARFRPTEAAR